MALTPWRVLWRVFVGLSWGRRLYQGLADHIRYCGSGYPGVRLALFLPDGAHLCGYGVVDE